MNEYSVTPKIQRRLQWCPDEIRRFVSLFRYYADVIAVDEGLCVELRDSLRDGMDVHVLATCIAAKRIGSFRATKTYWSSVTDTLYGARLSLLPCWALDMCASP